MRTSILRDVRTRGAGQLAPRRHALYVRGTRTSLGRAVRTAYRGHHRRAPQDGRAAAPRQANGGTTPTEPVPDRVATPTVDEATSLTMGSRAMNALHNRRLSTLKERLSKIMNKIMWWRGNISNPGQDRLVNDALSYIEMGLLLPRWPRRVSWLAG